jgi:hypothetical protein
VTFKGEVDDEDPVRRDPRVDIVVWWADCGPNGCYAIYLLLPLLELEDHTTEEAHQFLFSTVTDYIYTEILEMAHNCLLHLEDEVWHQQGFGRGSRETASRALIGEAHALDLAAHIVQAVATQE